jgi:phosphodiesterase/alkaline phosphatase D-like protein
LDTDTQQARKDTMTPKFLWISCVLFASLMAQDPRAHEQWITHGPILGRLGSRQVGIWARTAHAGAFKVRYGLQPDKLDMISPAATTQLERDNTSWLLLEGLKPNTKYYYEVFSESRQESISLPGSFHTLPHPDDFRDAQYNPRGLYNFSFEFACGNRQSAGSSGPTTPAYRTMLNRLKDKIDFAILDGDWLYEERRDYSAEQWMAQVRIGSAQAPRVVQLAPTIVGVWENYKLYLDRSENLAEWHRNIPSYFTMDDHEILNDVFGANEVGRRNRRAVFRDIAVQAWYDYLGWSNPVENSQGIHFGKATLRAGGDVLTDGEADFTKLDLKQAATLHVHWGGPNAGVNLGRFDREGGDPNAGVYEIVKILDNNRLRIRPAAKQDGNPSYSIGRLPYSRLRVSNADFFFLDTRCLRNMHDLSQRDKPGISMLGQTQKKWLMDGMRESNADFFFVVSSVNMMIAHIGGGKGTVKDDAWTAFLDEREQLIRFWDSLGKPVFVLTGDIHMSYTIKVTDRVWEFASGPHNSPRHPVGAAKYPPNGLYDSYGRKCDVRWSSYLMDDLPMYARHRPIYTVAKVNNVFNSPSKSRENRWLAYPHPHVIFQHFDGLTGDLLYSETIQTPR